MTRDADMIPTKESGVQYGAGTLGAGDHPQYQVVLGHQAISGWTF